MVCCCAYVCVHVCHNATKYNCDDKYLFVGLDAPVCRWG